MRSAAVLGVACAVLLSASSAPSAFAPRASADRSAAQSAASAARPKLVVLISIDQMRGDYIDRYGHQWSKGLKRLIAEGAWFRQADYPYYNTVTCAGHASLSTGTVPAIHGMVLNQWWTDNNTRQASCTEDARERLVSYGGPLKGVGHSARNIQTTTIADEMRLQLWPAPRVVSVSLKARSAITLGGHRPDAVIWLDEADGEWATSTAFAQAPQALFAGYVGQHALRGEMGRTWDRLLPLDRYVYPYTTENRRDIALVTTQFPHIVKGTGAEVGGAFTDAWESSPFSDEYLGALARTAIEQLKLGRGPAMDFLAIGYSALDKAGHDFGPEAHETQDLMARLDVEIGRLLDMLDQQVGQGQYVVGVSADHGVAPTPERVKAMGFDAGRINTGAIGRAIDEVLVRELGPGPYRTRVHYNDIYFNDGVYAKLTQTPAAMAAVIETIRKAEGVRSVYRKEDVSAADPFTRAVALSHYDGRSGDLKMLGRAHWITSSDTTTHGTGHRYDTRVPVILFGMGIRPGEYLEPASPIDLAPTLAYLAGVTMPDATGRVLIEALTRR